MVLTDNSRGKTYRERFHVSKRHMEILSVLLVIREFETKPDCSILEL